MTGLAIASDCGDGLDVDGLDLGQQPRFEPGEDATLGFPEGEDVCEGGQREVVQVVPHLQLVADGGSHRVTNRTANLAARLIRLPGSLTRDAVRAFSGDSNAWALGRLPTSIDNMNPESPFVATLADHPIAPGVRTHSIVAVRSDGPLEEADDGVVRYSSAHLPGVRSEKIIRSGHTMQAQPETIAEIMRILTEHLDEGDLASGEQTGPTEAS